MPFDSDKTLFEVYRDTTYQNRYAVVYYTELGEHDKERELNRAMAGQHFAGGFLKDARKAEAKAIIEGLLGRLNEGEALTREAFLEALGPCLAEG